MIYPFLLALALIARRVASQTQTDCNPLNTTCPDNAALGTTYNETWDQSVSELDSRIWNVTAGKQNINFDNAGGAGLSLYKTKDSVTAQSTFYIFWGQVEILMKAAPGTGVVSTLVLLSDDLDEIDFETFGGNTTHVSSNYYGHGDTSQFNAEYHPIDAPQDNFHNYTFNWDQNKLDWLINGNIVRTVPYAPSGQYPQTPSKVLFGVWSAGDTGQPEGTVKWAGGSTDWNAAPFSMYVKSIKVTDGSLNSTVYTYGDHSGSYESIKVESGESEAHKVINELSTGEKFQKHWQGLSSTAKIAIASSVGGVAAICAIAFAWFCVVQRKRGREERLNHDRRFEAEHAEMEAYRVAMSKGQFAVTHMGHGHKF